MAVYLLYRTRAEDRNAAGIHSVLVNAADEATARALANAAAPFPRAGQVSATEPKAVPDSWAAIDVSTIASQRSVWIEGDAVSLLGLTRGGDRVG